MASTNDPEKGTIVALNSLYAKDPYFVKRQTFPIKNSDELFLAACDGVLLSRLFMMVAPGVLPEKKLALDADISFLRTRIANRGRRGGDPNTKSVFQITQNLNAFNSSVSKVTELSSISISAEDILNLNTEVVFWALKLLLRSTIVARVSILHHPEFVRLREEGENTDALMMLDSETLILRWVNFQLRKAGCRVVASNLSGDFKDSEIFLQLLRQVAPPDAVDVSILNAALSVPPSRNERPACVVETINKLGCAAGITFQELVTGDKSAILTCLAALIQLYPAIEFPTENEIKNLEIVVGDLRSRVRELEEELSVSRRGKVMMEEMDELTKQIETLTTENKKLKDELDLSKNQVERVRQENSSLQSKMDALRSKQDDRIKDSMNQVDERFTGIQKSFEEMLQAKDKLIDDLQNRLKAARDEISEERKKLAEERKKNDPEAAAKLLMEMMSSGAASNTAPSSPNPNDARKEKKEKSEKDKEKTLERDKEKTLEREKDKSEKDKERTLEKAKKGGTIDRVKKRKDDDDVDKLKDALQVAEKKIKSLEEIVADLEDELKEEKEAFDNLIELQKKSAHDSKANMRQSFYSHKETIATGKKKKEENLSQETIALLVAALGKEAEEFLKNEAGGSNSATQIKYLVEVLLDIKEQQSKKVAALEFQIEKNREINDLMKEKVHDLALAQVKHKKFNRHHLLSLFGIGGEKEKETEKE